MIRPLSIDKAIKDFKLFVPDDWFYKEQCSKLIKYIHHLENHIKEYEQIDYKQKRLDLITVNEVIQEKNKLIEELTNLLEPKE